MRLLLASQSPRRRELLCEAGFAFEVIASSVIEIGSTQLSVRELTLGNAMRKACAVGENHDAVVLGADTLVACDGEVIGKPRDLREARAMLRRLGGREHDVCTGVCLARGGIAQMAFAEFSRVRFKRLSDSAITSYFATIDPLDKAGAYAAQGSGRVVIEEITGSVSNVIGLPMETTALALARCGIRPAR